MRVGGLCLLASVLIAVALPIWAGPAPLGLLAIIAAVGIVFALRDLPGEDMVFFGAVARAPLAVMATFTGFVLLQTLPAGLMAHPIWTSVAPALGRSVWGSVSVDTGETFLAALACGTLLGFFALATAVGMVRDRARSTLYLLVAVICAIASVSLGAPLLGRDVGTIVQARAAMPLCLVIAAGGLAGEAETHFASFGRRARPQGKDLRWPPRLLTVLLSAVGLGLSLGVGLGTGPGFVAASAAGLLVMASPFIASVTRTGIWGVTGIVLTAAVLGLALSNHLGFGGGQTVARGQPQAPDAAVMMLQDAPLLGTGLGTFEWMSGIYRLPGDGLLPPPGGLRLGVELGMPILILLLVLGLAAIALLLAGALGRGRGRIYPSLGAGAAAAILVQMATSELAPGFLSAFLLAVVGGLAFAQSKSRTKGF